MFDKTNWSIFTILGIFLLFINCGQGADTITTTTTSSTTTSTEALSNNMQKDNTTDLLILTLNLHTYQENNQEAKFNRIVSLINDFDIDLIAFQECAQNKDSDILLDETVDIRVDNMAYIITKKLKDDYGKDYYYKWDWAHYGWSVWEEGIAIVSKYPFEESDSTWISTSNSQTDITSRKIIYGKTTFPGIGTINFFSTHTHWMTSETDTEHVLQVTNIKNFVALKEDVSTDLSIVCGDYNCNAANVEPWIQPYNKMVENDDYVDTFLVAHPTANDLPQNSIFDTVKGDYPGRIDYIFKKANPDFFTQESEIVFTQIILGTVSDHYGVITKLSMN